MPANPPNSFLDVAPKTNKMNKNVKTISATNANQTPVNLAASPSIFAASITPRIGP